MDAAEQSLSARQAMQIAVEHYQAGRLPEAREPLPPGACRRTANADAFHLLGVIAHRAHEGEKAVELIKTAIRLHPAPSPPFFLNSLGEVYRALHRPDEAEIPYRQALQLEQASRRPQQPRERAKSAAAAGRGGTTLSQGDRTQARLCPGQTQLLPAAVGPRGFCLRIPLYENRFEAGDPGIMALPAPYSARSRIRPVGKAKT